jgi:phosphatidylglycerol:prolipoprotein diacylglycerol transferase
MWPYVVEWGWFKIGTYGVMMAIGFLTASWLLARDLKSRNLNPAIADSITLMCIVGGVLGAKLAYMLTEAQTFVWSDLFSGSGLTWHGGLILAAALNVGYFAWKKLPLRVMLDTVSPVLASGYAFGRLGCQISGDGDYGIPCTPDSLDRVFCMAYPNGIVPTHDIVHPTPVYEAVANFALFAILWKLRGRIKNPGVMFGLYLIGSGISRFLVEFIRQPESRPERFWGLRDAHLIALGQIVLGIVLGLWWGLVKSPSLPDYGVFPVAAESPVPAVTRQRRRKGK